MTSMSNYTELEFKIAELEKERDIILQEIGGDI